MKEVSYVPFGADFIGELHRLVSGKGPHERAAIVFPGKRPALYFKERLARSRGKPQYPPQCFSMETFIDLIARKSKPDFMDTESMDAVSFLYECLRTLPGHPFSRKGFGDFFWWGVYLLEFIDYLDTEMISDEQLLSLEKNAELGYDVPESINELLTHVIPLRRAFHEKLEQHRYFSRGYKYLCAVEAIKSHLPDEFDMVWFAGLFALSAAEKTVIRTMMEAGKAQVVLEGDPKDWPIMRSLLTSLDAAAQPVPCFVRPPAKIKLHAGIDTHTEILKAYDIIKEAKKGRTAVVLPLAEALFPLLSFAADRIDSPYNISMGYPVDRTSLYDLISGILKAQTLKRPDGAYPTAEYLSVISHPFIKNLDASTDLRVVLADIGKILSDDSIEGNLADRAFITPREIETALPRHLPEGVTAKIHELCFHAFDSAGTMADFADKLGDLLEFILRHTEVHSFILSGEIFRRILEALEDLKTTWPASDVLDGNPAENRRTICDCIMAHLSSLSLPFETKPIENLEIIGVLESRNINFDTVIVLDVNEGVLPQAKGVNPLIPLGIYDVLNIPSPEYREEIFRYSFERLIGSAGDVHLLYTDSEEKPRSRYIEKVLWEQERAAGAVNSVEITKSTRTINIHLTEKLPSVRKTEKICGIMDAKVYSPSSIDDYVVCPVLFYYKHILRFSERTLPSEDIEGSRRGSIIHDILQKTFSGYLGKEIAAEDFDDIRQAMRDAVKNRFAGKETSGDWYLFRSLAEYKLESFLKKHLQDGQCPFTIKHLEAGLKGAIVAGGKTVRLKGKVDRVDFDTLAGRYTIIDYKTGGRKQYQPGILKKCAFETAQDIHDHVNSFQLPIYVHLFKEYFGVPLEQVEAKLILLKRNIEEPLFGKMSAEEKGAAFNLYMNGITVVLKDLLDPEKPFAPFDTDNCATCAFNSLCHM